MSFASIENYCLVSWGYYHGELLDRSHGGLLSSGNATPPNIRVFHSGRLGLKGRKYLNGAVDLSTALPVKSFSYSRNGEFCDSVKCLREGAR